MSPLEIYLQAGRDAGCPLDQMANLVRASSSRRKETADVVTF
jgi:hypothetical protein